MEQSLSKNPEIRRENNNEKLGVIVEIARENDWEDYKKIRLEAIEKDPIAFRATNSRKEKDYNRSEEDWKKDLIGRDTFVILAKNKDIPVGMAHAILKTEGENQWGVRGVYLNKDFRGSGSGKKIMDLILDEIKNRGGKVITLNVTDTQEIAKGIYDKMGFKALERFEPKEEDGTTWPGGYWMKKEM